MRRFLDRFGLHLLVLGALLTGYTVGFLWGLNAR